MNVSDPTARTLLRHVASLGYNVKVTHVDDGVNMSAEIADQRQTVSGPDEYIAACRLALAVGVDLEDG